MRRLFLFIGLFTSVVAVNAQYQNQSFEVDQIRGCAPFTINITKTNLKPGHDCKPSPGTPCIMNFGTGNCAPNLSCENILTYTYSDPGTYKLKVIYQGSYTDSLMITVDPNIQPEFDVYSCANSKVEINITDKTYNTYHINFNSEIDAIVDKTINSGVNQTATFSYGAAGPHNITVQGQKTNAANNCDLKSKAFDAIATLPIPSIKSLTAKSVDTLNLAFTPATNIEYKSEIAINNSSSFQVYKALYGVNTLTVPNLNVDNNYYCLRLSSFDPCANTNKYSPPICSHNFDAAFVSGSDQLTWQTSSTGISKIRIKRDNSPIDSVSGSVTFYNDNAITCKTDYCYQLVSRYPSGAISTSLTKCGTAINSTIPTGINNTSAVVGEPSVDLVWLQDPAFTTESYSVLRGYKGGVYTPIGNNTSPVFTDPSYYDAGYCYQVNYTDKCGNTSKKGLPACPMLLKNNLDPYNDVTLNWSAYKGWNQGVKNYKLLRYYQPSQTPQTIYSGPDSTYFDQPDPSRQIIYYKVIASPIDGTVSQSISNELKVVRSINLFYPSAFNPESNYTDPATHEKVNRTFMVKGHFIATMKLQIFDRWGSLVFYSDSNEAWDGRKDGLAMPDATYAWTADGTDFAGNSFRRAGTVVLIRK